MSALKQEIPLTEAQIKKHPATVDAEAQLDAFLDLILEICLENVTFDLKNTPDATN